MRWWAMVCAILSGGMVGHGMCYHIGGGDGGPWYVLSYRWGGGWAMVCVILSVKWCI